MRYARYFASYTPEELAAQVEVKAMTRSYETGKRVVFEFWDPVRKAYAEPFILGSRHGVEPLWVRVFG